MDDNENPLKAAQRAIEERGYSLADMKRVGAELERERREWTHHFDQFLQALIARGDSDRVANPADIVETARKLADLRQEALQKRFADWPS